MQYKTVSVDQINQFDVIIDVRTPLEFAHDHIPGAINLPVLSNEERVEIGTLHKQVSPFAAKKLGSALVAKNISTHILTQLQDKAPNWRPLIYCWRGGQRSGAMSIILNQVGWRAHQLVGGYKAYRQSIVQALESLPQNYQYRVLTGPSGSGKTCLLQKLRTLGAQVLDLEALASHKGSVLGGIIHTKQPSQKAFDSALIESLKHFDVHRPIFIEAESKKIGLLRLPDALFAAMHASPCLDIQISQSARVDFLIEDYPHFIQNPSSLRLQIECLRGLHSNAQIDEWLQLSYAADLSPLVQSLLEHHYDPSYYKALKAHYATNDQTPVLALTHPKANLDLNTLMQLGIEI